MRCLTLAEELVARGHIVTLWAHLDGVTWLSERVKRSLIAFETAPANSLDLDLIGDGQFDWVVVDSYEISSAQISALKQNCQVLAIVDSDHRNIEATLYLDQNLGTQIAFPAGTDARQLLLGSDFALVRNDFLRYRSVVPSTVIEGTGHVVVFFGGSDPDGAVVAASKAILAENRDVRLTVICAERWIAAVEQVCLGANAVVLGLTPDLPHIVSTADVVVSAAGTSAWDVCTLGRAAVLVAVVDNQKPALVPIQRNGVALALDATGGQPRSFDELGSLVARLIRDDEERRSLVERCATIFDGKGKSRVVDRMESSLSL